MKYLVQVFFGAMVVVFSMVMIANKTANPEVYFSMLTGTVGYFLPHPHVKKTTTLQFTPERELPTVRREQDHLMEPAVAGVEGGDGFK